MSAHLLASLLLLIFSLQRLAMSQHMMDMALHSYDDQYLGCREQMMEELERGDYFQKEIAANKNYLSLWKKAQEALLKSPVGLLREMHESHATVLMAYTMNSSLHSQLNWATSIAGSSPEHYRHNFSFKYFHFYLTTAIQIMKQWQSSKESIGKPSRTVVSLPLLCRSSYCHWSFLVLGQAVMDALVTSTYIHT